MAAPADRWPLVGSHQELLDEAASPPSLWKQTSGTRPSASDKKLSRLKKPFEVVSEDATEKEGGFPSGLSGSTGF